MKIEEYEAFYLWELYVELKHRITSVEYTKMCFPEEAISSLYKLFEIIRETMKHLHPFGECYELCNELLEKHLRGFVTAWHCNFKNYNLTTHKPSLDKSMNEAFTISIKEIQEDLEPLIGKLEKSIKNLLYPKP